MTSSSNENIKGKIQILPDDMANKIAAGEVIERPASVVKELVENAIDAKATQILIDIQGAGKELIRVSDNGEGMYPDDAKRAFSRHATSKIIKLEDLDSIATLGFRGEALPSIASVAKVRMTTAREESSGGLEIILENGILKETKTVARPQGTTLEVQQLFLNTPARRKFLKRDSTETSHIIQVVTQQALVCPHIHFTLTHNGKRIFNALPTDHGLYRIAELLGTELTKELIRVEEDNGRYRLEGFISNPVYTRSNASYQYFYVNHRYIRDKVIMHATQQGYSHLLPKGQYPVLVLQLTMSANLLDVNVHPAKAEVRFAFQQEVHQFVSHAIKNALAKTESQSDFSTQADSESQTSKADHLVSGASKSFSSSDHHPSSFRQKNALATPPESFSSSVPTQLKIAGNRAVDLLYGTTDKEAPTSRDSHREFPFQRFEGKPVPVSHLVYSDFEPLGQLDQSFIILQGKGGILIVDQHIAHERILYERFRAAAKNRRVEIQQLLFPVTLSVSPAEAQTLSTHSELLKGLGLELEPFGKNDFLLRTVPAFLKNDDPLDLIRKIIEELQAYEKTSSVEEKYEELIVMMSCRNAIKVNHPLGLDQIQKLLYDLEQTEMPFTCPHGRPITLLIEMESILKKFLRK